MGRSFCTHFLIIVIFAGLATSCINSNKKNKDNISKKSVTVYTTTADRNKMFEQTTLSFSESDATKSHIVNINPSIQYQTIDGFGAAITGSTAYNLLHMDQESRTAFLKEVFDPKEGLGSSLIRVSIGSSDFGLDEYTCCDIPGIENFELHKLDRRDVIPILKEIYAINPNVKIIGSPWSAPKWMKREKDSNNDYDSWTSGRLKKEYYDDYAFYFVRWIQTMRSEGFNIYAITPQNEPLNPGNSMSMLMYWQEQADFIKTALGPAFEQTNIKTKILVFDHNYNFDNIESEKDYPLKIFADTEASKYIAGSAWHNYGGSVSKLDDIVKAAPEKEIFFTEASIGKWNYNFSDCLLNDFNDIFIGTMQRNGKGVTLWNLMLDENGAPNRPGGCNTCFGAVEISSGNYVITDRKSHYYNIAHASKVIKPGAVRIETNGYTKKGLSYLAVQNPDKTIGVIICNKNNISQTLNFQIDNNSVRCDIPAKSIVSLIW